MPRTPNSNLGHRILVYGVTGSGKSTAAKLIAARTLLPLTLADELTWAPDWVPVAEDEQRRLFAAVAAQDRSWVAIEKPDLRQAGRAACLKSQPAPDVTAGR